MNEIRSEIKTSSISAAGARSALLGIFINASLAAIKAAAGILGNSYALIADAIESTADIFSSLVVYFGLKMAGKPADINHPYGHGKFEPLASVIVALILMAAAILIAVESVREIITPHHAPAPFTLIVLAAVIIIKETLFKHVFSIGNSIDSNAVKTDAWHHRSDALTSAAAFLGISIAILGGSGYESADDFAAMIAAFIIAINSVRLLKPSLYELLDAAPDPSIVEKVRQIAAQTPGVFGTHNCLVRKVGFDYFVALDVLCDPDETIRHGHDIAHAVGENIRLKMPSITKVLVHIEPRDDYARNLS